MSRLMTKPTKWLRPAKTQICLGIRPVWPESSLCAKWVAKDPSFLRVVSGGWSDWADTQTDQSLRWAHNHFVSFVMRRLISINADILVHPTWLILRSRNKFDSFGLRKKLSYQQKDEDKHMFFWWRCLFIFELIHLTRKVTNFFVIVENYCHRQFFPFFLFFVPV